MKKETKSNCYAEFTSESCGRSMVEMIATLALIAVLTYGAVSGIRYVLNKKTANEIMKEALTQASEIKVRRRQKVHSSGEVKYAYSSEYIKSRTYSENGFELILKTKNNISAGVCEMLVSEEPVSIFDSITTTTGECKTYNTIVFTTDTDTLPSRGEFDACKNENCCGHGTCNPDTGYCECNDGWMGDRCCEQNCPLPDRVQTCLSLDNEYDENDCISIQYYKVPCRAGSYCDLNGECQDCPAGTISAEGKNECEECPTGLIPNSDQSKCICPAGQIYMEKDSQCHQFECMGGPTYYNCYIDGGLCGYQCNADGSECDNGVCLDEECPDGEPLSLIKYDAQYKYGCLNEYSDGEGGITCYGQISKGYYKCYSETNGKICMQTNFVSTEGVCDESVCTKLDGTWMLWGSDRNSYRGACSFNEGELLCIPYNDASVWSCYKNGYLCGKYCADPLSCGNCSEDICPDGTTYNSTTGYCENSQAGYYCTTDQGSYYQSCYKNDASQCMLYSSASLTVSYGFCENKCPSGTEFAYINILNIAYWGCLTQVTENETVKKLECYFNSAYVPAECWYDGVLCGRYCEYDGTGCGAVYLPQCTKEGYCPQTGYDMSDGCTCEGNVTSIDAINYCCPAGHLYINGGCTLTRCDDETKPYITQDGECVTECPSGQTADENKVCG